MRVLPYARERATAYAKAWALKRNPAYYDFSKIGGDCTNFISQCLFAGCGAMNFTPTFGWYYAGLNNRAPAWTGVEFLSRFLLANAQGVGGGAGPFAKAVELSALTKGDLVQLGNAQGFFHTLILTDFQGEIPLFSAHSRDVLGAPLSAFSFSRLRCLHILGVRVP